MSGPLGRCGAARRRPRGRPAAARASTSSSTCWSWTRRPDRPGPRRVRGPAGHPGSRPARLLPGHRSTGGVLRASGLQDSITRMAPILLIAAGLIVAFRASLWNLGSDGQYLLAVAVVAGIGARLAGRHPAAARLARAGDRRRWSSASAWTLIPAILKARYGLNEIVTTLMMTFIGVGLANLLVKGPFNGPPMVPQTAVVIPSDCDALRPAWHPDPHRGDRGDARRGRRLVDLRPNLVRDAPRRDGRQRPCRRARRDRRAAADRDHVPAEWRADRSGGRRRHHRASSATCEPTGTRPTG